MGVVGKSDFKENPKSDLDLDLGFVKTISIITGKVYNKKALRDLVEIQTLICLRLIKDSNALVVFGESLDLIFQHPNHLHDIFKVIIKVSRKVLIKCRLLLI